MGYLVEQHSGHHCPAPALIHRTDCPVAGPALPTVRADEARDALTRNRYRPLHQRKQMVTDSRTGTRSGGQPVDRHLWASHYEAARVRLPHMV
ncbi:DUF6233 domain-containing protein [Streptomyces sp. NPDC055749]